MHLSSCNNVKKLNLETKEEVLWGWFLEDRSPRTPNRRPLLKANAWALYQDCQCMCVQVCVSFVKLVKLVLGPEGYI